MRYHVTKKSNFNYKMGYHQFKKEKSFMKGKIFLLFSFFLNAFMPFHLFIEPF